MTLKLSILDLFKWFAFVASAGMAVGAGKEELTDAYALLKSVDKQNETILEDNKAILLAQELAKHDRDELRMTARENNRIIKASRDKIKTLGRNYAYLANKLDPLESE